MSHSFIDRSNNYFTQNNQQEETQNKIDPVAQLKELNDTTVREWGLFKNHPAQMFAKEEDLTATKSEGEKEILSKTNNRKDELDYNLLASTVFKAMKGLGTDEEAIYNALAQLNNNDEKIKEFKTTYKKLYERNVVEDIYNEFSNNVLIGKEYDKAISYLMAKKSDESSNPEKIKTKDSSVDNSAQLPDTNTSISKNARDLRETFQFSGWISESVGLNMRNNTDDVRKVSFALLNKGIKNIPEESKSLGKCNEKLIKAIKNFQESVNLTADGMIGTYGGTIRALLGYSSGLKQIYPSRDVINAELNDIKLTASVGQEIDGNKPENKPDDVRFVAFAIKSSGINVPEDSLAEGKSSQAFIDSIKEFQQKKAGLDKPDGNVGKNGHTYGKLKYYHNIGTIARDEKGNYGKSKDPELYYNSVDLLSEKLGIKDGSRLQMALNKARRAATDANYFDQLTKGINEKMIIKPEDIEVEGMKLSSVLEDRMSRFHKFLVAAGLYIGDMSVSDGVRSPKEAHRFAVQYYILTGKAEETIKQNLIKLYNQWGKAEDEDNNLWAKKEHFTFDSKGKAISVDFKKVQEYVESLNLGRSNKTDPAAVGYNPEPFCLPLPANKEPSAHTKGLALDIDSDRFVNKKESMIDLIALNFGLVRNGSAKETWHFELSNLGISAEEKQIINKEKR